MFEIIKGRKIKSKTKVYIYYNLHKKCFSVKALEGEYKGLVVMHSGELMVKDAKFIVNQKGRERVLKEKRKNVHAGVVGFLGLVQSIENCKDEVTYNPYLFSTFVYKECGKTVHNAKNVLLKNQKIFVAG